MKAQEENIRKMEQENAEKIMELLFNAVIEGKSVFELDVRELKDMIKLIALKKTKVAERKKQLQEEDQPIKDKIKEKNPKEIRKTFSIKNNLTPEEGEEFRDGEYLRI
ncbi:hypothetical protein MTR67_003691 [Solanum verrucosum]|uniref:SKP1 component dimerisation domain-containing protein n=1 Tax=Solanum verrucosum TaxID=315347 RepID=A0AAF0PT69_SOLVR|nr:hypothetical protein MTR67_003691 [Solanum verrucosum]